MANEVHCPKCGSTQITANKKGFSGKKAVVGGLLTGGVGLLAGTLGSNKVIITCLACGHTFRPGASPIVEKSYSFNKSESIKAEPPAKKGVVIFTFIALITLITAIVVSSTRADKKSAPEAAVISFNQDSLFDAIKNDKTYHVTKVTIQPDHTLNITVKDPEPAGTDNYFDNAYHLYQDGYVKEIAIYKGKKLMYHHGYLSGDGAMIENSIQNRKASQEAAK